MKENKNCHICNGNSNLIFACSGGADVGAISDLAARKMTANGVGKMFCLAGIGGRVEGIMKTTTTATKLLAIDGCPLDCAKKCLEKAGYENFEHIRITDHDLKKGASPATKEHIDKIATAGTEALQE